eukprot:SM000251S08833  [mRNA]  locus=s251:138298:139488:- [translate_table: standard]
MAAAASAAAAAAATAAIGGSAAEGAVPCSLGGPLGRRTAGARQLLALAAPSPATELGRQSWRRRQPLPLCRASAGVGPGSPGYLTPELKEALHKFVVDNKVVLFMKGNRQFPQCGFSNTCVQILNAMAVPYETVNILEDERLRQGMKEYSRWPTFPQIYIDGEFFGGCDIAIEAYQNGELKEVLEKALLS